MRAGEDDFESFRGPGVAMKVSPAPVRIPCGAVARRSLGVVWVAVAAVGGPAVSSRVP